MKFVFRDIDDSGSVIGTSLLDGAFEFPRLVLKRSALEHNITAMAKFCTVHDVSLAPHAKTTMAPAILRRQIESGAWGMTVATMQQLRACVASGVARVLVANEIVNPRSRHMTEHSKFYAWWTRRRGSPGSPPAWRPAVWPVRSRC